MAGQSFDIQPRRGQFARLTITGHHTFRAGTRRAQATVDHYSKRLVLAEAREVLKRALFFCPIKTGRLRSTGRVRRQRAGLRGVGTHTVEVVFGGRRASYAVEVHERLDVRHAPPTQAKFLWRALVERRMKALGRMGGRLRGALL